MSAKRMALGGVTAALALVILCLGTIIPLATYVCPIICCVLLQCITSSMGKRGCWVWYSVVSLLAVLMAPDKEAAAVFVFLGYYPILKPKLDKMRLGLLWKLLLFNAATLAMYWLLINLFGMAALQAEFAELGLVMGAVTLALGNLTFLLLDRALSVVLKKFR